MHFSFPENSEIEAMRYGFQMRACGDISGVEFIDNLFISSVNGIDVNNSRTV